jgi:hypothetical protein
VDVWLIRGDWSAGGFIPDFKVPDIERQLGADRVVTIDGAPHSPQRTHPEATIVAILRALDGGRTGAGADPSAHMHAGAGGDADPVAPER